MDTHVQIFLDHRQTRGFSDAGVASYGSVLRRIVASCGDDLDPAAVAAYIADRARQVAPNTVAYEVSVLTTYATWRRRQGLPGDPLALVEPVKRRKALGKHAPKGTIQTIDTWLREPPAVVGKKERFLQSRNRRFLGLCLYAGLRLGEACNLAWDQVDLDDSLRVEWGKGGKDRMVPVAAPLRAILAEVPVGQRHGPVAGDVYGNHLTTHGADHLFVSYLPRVLAVRVTAHQLRRAFATRLDEQGVSLPCIQELLGHEDLKTTQRYIGVSAARKKEALRALEQGW